ncbi:MAG: NUDIX domain-containing protein [bacterium]
MHIVNSAGGVITRNKNNQIELLCLTTKNGKLALPKGHIGPLESAEQAAVRELGEEVGVISPRIVAQLGQVNRTGTEPDGEKVDKIILYYLMDGEGFSFDHDQNYVWVSWADALGSLQHKEEQYFLNSHEQAILLNPSVQFSNLKPWLPYDDGMPDLGKLSEVVLVKGRDSRDLPHWQTAVIFGAAPASIPSMFTRDCQLLIVKAYGKITYQANNNIADHIKICPRVIENLIDEDIPESVDLFYAPGTLNLSDTKTFFLINQIRKKMKIGGQFVIEGRGTNDLTVSRGRFLGSNLVIFQEKIIRVWTPEFVQNILVSKIGLELISQEPVARETEPGLLIWRFLLQKTSHEVF